MSLILWDGLLWLDERGGPFAFCPDHRKRLDLANSYGHLASQDSALASPHIGLVCPQDEKMYPIPHNDFWLYQRRFRASQESKNLKDADIVDLDGYQVPIVKAVPPEKDSEYWAEVRINDTKRGKQLVVYAGKRGDADKTQMFLDLENDKITFDQNNMHPNDVFTKVTADFRSGKSATLEQDQ